MLSICCIHQLFFDLLVTVGSDRTQLVLCAVIGPILSLCVSAPLFLLHGLWECSRRSFRLPYPSA